MCTQVNLCLELTAGIVDYPIKEYIKQPHSEYTSKSLTKVCIKNAFLNLKDCLFQAVNLETHFLINLKSQKTNFQNHSEKLYLQVSSLKPDN